MSSQSSGVTRPGHALPGGTLALRGAGVHWALWGSRQWLQGVGDIWGRLWYEGMIMMFKWSYGGFQKWGYPKMNGLLLFFNIIYVYNIDVWTHIPWFTDEHPSTHSRVGRRTGWATSRRLVWSWHLGDKAWVSPWTNGQCWMMLDDGLGGSLISLFFRH